MARPESGHQRLVTVAVMGTTYAVLWLVLSNNQGWGFGLVVIALAVICALSTELKLPRISWRYLPGFVLFFLSRMLVGGIDVARRTLGRKPDVEPGWVEHRLQGTSESAHLLLSATTGLLPGTLAARIDGDIMRVHSLDTRSDWQRDIGRLETHLERLFPPGEAAS